MKKYLSGFLAIILALGLSAFSVKPQQKTTDPLFHWFSGTVYTGFEDSIAGRGLATDCTGESDVCEYGYDDPEDFIGGDPENGLSGSAAPDAEIRELP